MSKPPKQKKTRTPKVKESARVSCPGCGFSRKRSWAVNQPCAVCNTWWSADAEAAAPPVDTAEEEANMRAEDTLRALFAGL